MHISQGVCRVLRIVAFVALSGAARAQGQQDFGSVNVGSPVSAPVTISSSAAGSVNTVRILMLGATNQDYSDGGGSCSSATFLTAGQSCTETITFTPAYAGARLGAAVLLDFSGNVLGTALLQGIGVGPLAVFLPGNETTVAGSGNWTLTQSDVPALQSDLNLPSSVALDGAGNLYIADSGHHMIRMVSSGNGAVIHGGIVYPQAGNLVNLAGNGNAGWSGDGSLATTSGVQLNNPTGLAIDGLGNLYIADTGNNVIRRISAATGIISTIAGTGTSGSSGDLGPALSAMFDGPRGISLDASNNIFIADTGNHKIRAVCASAGTSLFGSACQFAAEVITVAGNGTKNSDDTGTYSGDGGLAATAGLNFPYAVAFDAQGNMYIPDAGNNRIRKVTSTAVISTFAGTGTAGYWGDGNVAVQAQLQAPSSVAVDSAGNVYISDTQNSSIRKVNVSTQFITTVVHGGVGSVLIDGSLTTTQIYGPRGIWLDNADNIYVADSYNMRVRMIQSNTALLDFTATATPQGNISNPQSQTIENDGNADLVITAISPDSNSAIDSSGTSCTSSVPLASGMQCTVSAEFAPTTSGDPLLANISVAAASNASPLLLIVAGDSPPVNSTSINVSSTQNPAVFGQKITYTASVSTGVGTGSLAGTLAFYDGAQLLATGVAVDSIGNGSFATSSLSVGTHSIVVTYSGDSKHYDSTSSAIAQVVMESTAVTVSVGANPVYVGGSVTLTATVSVPNGGGITPDGQVAFFDGATLLSTVLINTSGVGSLTTTQLTQGMHTITAVYQGDSGKFVSSSTSAAISLDVTAPSSVTVASSVNPSVYGTAIVLTAAVSSTSGVQPTGSVSYFDGAQQIGSAAIDAGTSAAHLTVSALVVGAHTISVSYAGDTNLGASTSASILVNVTQAQTSTILAASPTSALAGLPVTLTATVAVLGATAAITGNVLFTDGSAILGQASLGAGGSATLSATLSTGAHSIVASYLGNANDAGSTSVPATVTVTRATSLVAITSSGTTVQALSTVTLSAVVSGAGVTPTGTVSFLSDGVVLGTASLSAAGVATFSTSALQVGTHILAALYSGDADNDASSSASLSEVVTAISTRTALLESTPSGDSTFVVLIATTTAGSGPIPTGTITFLSGNTVLGTAQLNASGVATLSPSLQVAPYDVVAQYSGNSIDAASSSQSVTVYASGAAFTVAFTPTSSTVVSGQSVTLTVSLATTNAFSGAVYMGCLGVQTSINCQFSSSILNLSAGATQNVKLTIYTDPGLAASQNASLLRPGMVSTLLAGLCFPMLVGGMSAAGRRRRYALWCLIGVVALTAMLMMNGCGSKLNTNYAAPGTYVIQIGATSVSTTTSQFHDFTLTVTK